MRGLLAAALGAALLLSAAGTSRAALVVNPTNSAETLAAMLQGPGITVLSAGLTGADGQQGTFSGGSSIGLDLDSGVLLTSGGALLASGPNDQAGAGADLGTAGSTALNGLLPGFTTYDADILSITFTTQTDCLFVSYAFASEEYDEWVGTSSTDLIGIFLDSLDPASNIALIPGTTDPVAVNTLNSATNDFYYVSNPALFDLQYDGFSRLFTAEISGLAPGEHTLYLMVADAGDHILDSALFVQALTGFDPNPTPVPEPGAAALLAAGLAGAWLLRRRARN